MGMLCDCCGKDCMDSIGYNNEYMSLTAIFGYGSNNKDGEKWSANICESCVEKYLSNIIKFKTEPVNLEQERKNNIIDIIR